MGPGQSGDWGSGYKRLRLSPSEGIKEYSTEYLSFPTVHLPPPSSSSSLLSSLCTQIFYLRCFLEPSNIFLASIPLLCYFSLNSISLVSDWWSLIVNKW